MIFHEAIRKAKEGEKIMLVYPTQWAADADFRSNPGFDANITNRFWKFASGGVLAFRDATMDMDRLRGLSIDIWFVHGAERVVSREFWEVAAEVSRKYRDTRRKNL